MQDLPQPQPIFKLTQETIAFAYLYNVNPDKEILDVDFNGYKVLPVDMFRERYVDHLYNLTAYQMYAIENLVIGLTPEYVLIATKLPNGKGGFDDLYDIDPNLIFGAFVNTILYFRLHTSSDLQMGTFFISYVGNTKPAYRNIQHTDFGCLVPKLQYVGYDLIREPVVISLAKTIQIAEFILKFDSKKLSEESELLLALITFNRACNTSDAFYKITGFVTVLESLLAGDGKEGEISFKLRTRLVYILKNPHIAKFVRDIYGIRSAIAHVGGFNKRAKSDYAEFTEPKFLFDQIKILESLCQQTILYFMHNFVEKDKFNIQNIISELDKEIFEKVGKTEEVVDDLTSL